MSRKRCNKDDSLSSNCEIYFRNIVICFCDLYYVTNSALFDHYGSMMILCLIQMDARSHDNMVQKIVFGHIYVGVALPTTVSVQLSVKQFKGLFFAISRVQCIHTKERMPLLVSLSYLPSLTKLLSLKSSTMQFLL